MKSEKFIIMHPKDNCATSLISLAENEEIKIIDQKIKINQYVPSGHKFAIIDIEKGEYVIKYGEIIGIATAKIRVGDWIHTHNIKSHYLEVSKK